jgi:hypothetical protein
MLISYPIGSVLVFHIRYDGGFYEKKIEYLMDCFGDIVRRAESGNGGI